MRWASPLILLLLLVPSIAAQITGRVVGVNDGDTITVLAEGNKQIKVRLAGIDAPEKGQDFSDKAKRHLSDLVYGRTVKLEGSKKDQYGRLVAKVLLGGDDINRKMIEAGLAWYFKRYKKDLAWGDQVNYEVAEVLAQQRKINIWSHAHPVAPWDFRSNR